MSYVYVCFRGALIESIFAKNLQFWTQKTARIFTMPSKYIFSTDNFQIYIYFIIYSLAVAAQRKNLLVFFTLPIVARLRLLLHADHLSRKYWQGYKAFALPFKISMLFNSLGNCLMWYSVCFGTNSRRPPFASGSAIWK